MGRKKENLADVLGDFFVAVPWWMGPPMAFAAYGIVRFALPALFPTAGSTDGDPSAVMNRTFAQVMNPLFLKLAPLVAGAVLLIWVMSLAQKAKRGALLRQAGDIDRLKGISWHDFELLVGEYYRRRGFKVEERGGSSADGGVDLVLRRDGQTALVQCKHWKAFKVGVKPVRELCGVMSHENATRGILVTSGRFTAEAETFAGQNRIELVSGGALVEMVRSVQGTGQREAAAQPTSSLQHPALDSERTPACPRCGGPMKLRTAQRGAHAGSQFWGCSRYPNCSGIVNLGSR